eukprot:gene2593-3554_t
MSQLPSIEQFEQVLLNILGTDNDLRKRAEEDFQKSTQVPDYCVSSLLHLINSSKNEGVRALSVLLLRKNLSERGQDSLYEKLSTKLKAVVKEELLKALQNEKSPHLRHKLEYAISSFGSSLLAQNDFPELFQILFEWVKPNTPSQLRESSLNIFSQLANQLLEEGIKGILNDLKQILGACLKDNDFKVQIAAFKATSGIVLVLKTKKSKQSFMELVPLLLGSLGALLSAQEFVFAKEALDAIIEILIQYPGFFKKNIDGILTAMFTISRTTALPEELRHLSMETIISITESLPQIVGKVKNFVETMVPTCLEFMVEIEEDEDWADQYEDDDLDLTNYDVGLESLDRLALSVGGELIAPSIFKLAPNYLGHKSWKYRHAGIMSIAQTAEGCVEQYEGELEKIVGMNVKLLSDVHPRVRYAAIQCLAQISTDFSPIIQKNFHKNVIPALLSAMDDKVPKVQSHAATAVVNFVEESDKTDIQPYLDALLSKLLDLLKSSTRFVQEQALSSIAAVADCAEDLFIKYYDYIVPFLKEILSKAKGKNDRLLRARAMECISLVGLAVGKDKFGNDSQEVMQLLLSTQIDNLESDDPQIHYVQQAYARIAKCLKESFSPYLDYVIPYVIQCASVKPEVIVADADEEAYEEEEGMDSVTISIKGVGEKRISIRTSTLEDKNTACNLLYSYIVDLKELMLKYVEEITKLMIPLLNFAYLDEIRETAARILPELINCLKVSIEKNLTTNSQLVKQLLNHIVSSLLEAIKVETSIPTSSIFIESLHETIQYGGDNCLNSQELETICNMLSKVLIDSVKRKKETDLMLQEEDIDEEEKDKLQEDSYFESEFISSISEFIGSLFKTHGNTFVQYFSKVNWPIFVEMLKPEYGTDEHRIALCVICDFIEFGNGAVNQFYKIVIPALFTYSQDSEPEVRQAAAYGLGCTAQFGGQTFSQISTDTVNKLIAIIQQKDSKNKKNIAATCNAVSAIFKVIKYQGNMNDSKTHQLLEFWINSLPCGGDKVEAKIVHSNLVDLIKSNSNVIFGDQNKNVPQIIKIFAKILYSDVIDEKIQPDVISILKGIQSMIPNEVLQNIFNSLDQTDKENFAKAMGQQ